MRGVSFCLLFSLSFFLFDFGESHEYRDALSKSILFFEGQRSGPLPHSQRMKWRSASALSDGSLAKVNLTGGYYDAGDNLKFNLPMAYSATMLSWGVIEYGKRMGSELKHAKEAIKWATDYLLKCATATPGTLYVGVGDPNADHKCWERPEDMDTVRSVYSVSSSNPGSDVAGETAAALAAASVVFRKSDRRYSRLLLHTAKKVFDFAMQYQGAYSDKLGSAVCPFYCSYSGFKDELLWGASWLLMATRDTKYSDIIKSLGASDQPDIFSWDNKYAGAYVLLSRKSLLKHDKSFDQYKGLAENFMCKILPNSPSTSTKYTQGGMMYKMPHSNLQYVTSITFLVTTYAKYIKAKKTTFSCGNVAITPQSMVSVARRQVDYILGDNPKKMSYMVGFGAQCPQKYHHRAASLPSLQSKSEKIGCDAGFEFLKSSNSNPNLLTGAIVGGPDENDAYPDQRDDYSRSEPSTYINAAIVGPLAYFSSRT